MYTPQRLNRDTRGVSSLVGTILLVAIVVAGSAGVFAVSGAGIADIQDSISSGQAENVFSNMDSEVSKVVLGSDSDGQTVIDLSVPQGEQSELEVVNDGNITIRVESPSAPTLTENVRLNTLRYRNNKDIVAYQGGGVWAKEVNSRDSRMVSPPEFYYTGQGDTATVTLPLVQFNNGTLGPVKSGYVTVSKDNSSRTSLPLVVKNNSVVELDIESEYYRAWGNYFIDRTEAGSVTYDDTNETATVILFGPNDSPKVTGGLMSAGTNLGISNNNIADSYNSSQGSYSATKGNENNVVTNRDVQLTNKASINGDLVTSGRLQMTNNAEITGNAYVEGDVQLQNNADIYGDVVTEGAVTLGGGSTVHGDIRAGGPVTFSSNNPEVKGSVYSADDIVMDRGSIGGDAYADEDFEFTYGKADVGGTIHYGDNFIKPTWNNKPTWGGLSPGASVSAPVVDGPPTVGAVTSMIQDKKTQLMANNNNSATSAIIGSSLDFNGGVAETRTLTSGRYYVDDTQLGNGDELVYDTTAGDIEIVIDGDFQMNGDSEVNVIGPNDVRVYVPDGRNYQLVNNAQSYVTDESSTQFFVYLEPSSKVQFSNNAQFVGVIYGPGGANDGVDISVSNNADIYGALVGQVGSIPNRYGIHYDEALKNTSPTPIPPGAPITYLHVTENEMSVETR